jgi:hypothetical protein
VLVIGTEGNTRSGTLGDILALRTQGARRGGRAVGRRHARHAGDRQVRLPGVLQRRRTPPPSMANLHPVGRSRRRSASAACRSIPATWIVADEDGAIVDAARHRRRGGARFL